MNLFFAIFALTYVRAQLATLANAEPEQRATLTPRRIRYSRHHLRKRAAGAGARRIDAGAGIISQARGP